MRNVLILSRKQTPRHPGTVGGHVTPFASRLLLLRKIKFHPLGFGPQVKEKNTWRTSLSNVRIVDVWDQKETVVVYVMTKVAAKGDRIWYRLGAAEETYGPIHHPICWLVGLMEGVSREETRTEVESVGFPGWVRRILKTYSGRRTY